MTTKEATAPAAPETEDVKVPTGPMADLLTNAPSRPKDDDVVEGPIIAIGRARVFVDLAPFGTGIIYGSYSE